MDNARLAEITKLIGALTALVLAVMGAVSIFVGNPAGVSTDTTTKIATVEQPAAATETKVDTGDPGRAPDEVVKVPPAAAAQASDSPELQENLRSEQPAGVPQAALDESQDLQEDLARSDQLPIVTPDAAPSQRGCISRFVVNYSSRRGVRPRVIVLHYTVSRNRPGWDDVYSVVNLFNTASFQASSNYVIDADGNCAYIVRESDKAWTQAGGNPYAISFEVIDYGDEKTYMNPAGYQKLALVIHDISERWDIPVRLGAINGCAPSRPGIVQHKDGGACWGGHHDISPFSTQDVLNTMRPYLLALDCDQRCQRVRELRGKHQRTHRRFRARDCRHKQSPANGYCRRLRNRNKAVHLAAKREHINLKGTYQ